MQLPQFREILADYNGIELTTEDFSVEQLEKIISLLTKVLPNSRYIRTFEFWRGISSKVEESRTNSGVAG